MRVENGRRQPVVRGNDVQVSRLGNPLVNEVVVPVGLKDYFNASKPKADERSRCRWSRTPSCRICSTRCTARTSRTRTPSTAGIQRADLIQVFLTGRPDAEPARARQGERDVAAEHGDRAVLTTDCSTLGVIGGDVAGFPNGRRLSDDIIDVSLRVVLGVLLPDHQALADTIGDGVDANDVPFLNAFPYVAYPSSGSDTSPHS